MKTLTAKQEAALREVAKRIDKCNKDRVHVHHYYKDSWARKGGSEGIHRLFLDALEKKGYIKQHNEVTRQTGVYNPKAESWGYSTYILDISAELTEKARDWLGVEK